MLSWLIWLCVPNLVISLLLSISLSYFSFKINLNLLDFLVFSGTNAFILFIFFFIFGNSITCFSFFLSSMGMSNIISIKLILLGHPILIGVLGIAWIYLLGGYTSFVLNSGPAAKVFFLIL